MSIVRLARPYFRFRPSMSQLLAKLCQTYSSGPAARLPRVFPSTGFEKIDPTQSVEEERLPAYRRGDYYPVHIGQVIHENYQVVAKLGYGSTSTVWLSRDLSVYSRDGKFWALKIHINTLKHNQELAVYQHLSGLCLDHPGRQHVRQFRDTFKLAGPNDIHTDNLLIAITDDSILETVEDNELHRPSARKYVEDNVIHVSQYMLGGAGGLTICDLGQARIGKVHRSKAMPTPYRAPEIILGMTWGNSVDVWSVGLLAWDLLQQEGIFRVYDQSEELNDAHHLAAMTSLLGPPPDVFLRRSDKTSKYWNKDGEWHGPVPLPPRTDIKSLETNLSGEDRDKFLDFISGVLTWLPEDRLNSFEAYFHPWLRGEGAIE
ncbi:hypothetical protein HG530_006741 [Fusarium avenaceum]|nr:hypothetical protein HG530_006741 [Fusarium avenaceum]